MMRGYDYKCSCENVLDYDYKTDEYFCQSCGFRISREELE